jgi:hypothetical protein
MVLKEGGLPPLRINGQRIKFSGFRFENLVVRWWGLRVQGEVFTASGSGIQVRGLLFIFMVPCVGLRI